MPTTLFAPSRGSPLSFKDLEADVEPQHEKLDSHEGENSRIEASDRDRSKNHAADSSQKQGPDLRRRKHMHIRYRFLTSNEWAILARGIGALGPSSDTESQCPIYPSASSLFPHRGMLDGLYKDVVLQRRKFF